MIEHTCLHQILHNQFFLICSGGIVKENVVGQGSRISVSIWTCHISTGGRDHPDPTYSLLRTFHSLAVKFHGRKFIVSDPTCSSRVEEQHCLQDIVSRANGHSDKPV